jgi:hypothetical protein
MQNNNFKIKSSFNSKGFFLLMGLFFLLIPDFVFAQAVKFEATVNKNNCEVNENIQLTFTSNTSGDLELPDIKNGKIVAGPSTGYSTYISTINGKRSVVTSYTYTYVLRFTKKGDQLIPPAKLVTADKTYYTQPINVAVGASTSSSSGNETAGKNEDVFITISTNKNKIYKGEHLVATYKLYSRYVRYSHQLVDINFPTPSGFWLKDVENAGKLNMIEETVNGKRYGVVALKKTVLYAQKDGKMKLEPFTSTVKVSDFFASEDFKVTSNSPAIEVLELPANAPEGFNGAVGDFNFEVKYSKSELKVNDALDITITIRGNGNIKLLDDFVLELPEEMEKFDPEITDTVNVTTSGMTGRRVYKYLVIPRASGKYKLPPIKFSYFDPESKSYKSLTSGEFELNVLKGDGTEDNTVINKSGDLKVIDKNIHDLRAFENDKRVKGDYFFGTGLFFISWLAGPLAFFLFIFIRKKSEKSEQQLGQQKIRKATRIAIKQMQHAKSLLDANNIPGFYEEAMKTLYEYTSTKLRLSNAEFTKENIRKFMIEKKIEENTIQQFVQIIENCEMARFGGYASGGETGLYIESIRLIENMEDKL